MTEKSWIAIKKGSKEDMPSTKKVQTSGLAALKGIVLDQKKREITQITYELNGVWKGAFKISNNQYDTLSVPGAGAITSEGLPEVPQEGIFVAVPNGATNFEVKVIQKKMQAIPGTWQLKPAPKPITEKEYLAGKEEYLPRKDVYSSDKEFPDKDFEFLGLKQLEGIPVIHLIVYLAQYKPLSKSLSVVKAMTIEVSYDVPPQKDAVPRTRSIHPILSDLILDSENTHELTIDDNRDANMSMEAALHTLAVPDNRSESLTHGLTWREPVNKIDLIPDLKRADIISEYVIITTPALTAAVQPCSTLNQAGLTMLG